MQEYRLYFIDPSDRINGAVELYCTDDAEAVQRAMTRVDGVHWLELWQGARRVSQIRQPVA